MEGTALVTSPDGRWWWDGAAWRPLAGRVLLPYASGAVRAAYAVAFLAALVIVQLIVAGERLFDSGLFYTALSGGPEVDAGGYATINAASIALTAVTLGCWLCAVVAFLLWLHRAAANLPALGASGLRFTPGWAVGWWLVPVANLVMPLLVMVEAWRASDPRVGATDRAARSRLSPGVAIPVWWACWLVLAAVSVVSVFVSLAVTDREKLVLFATGALEAVATGVCFALTIVVVLMLDARQARKQSALEAPTPAA